MENKDFSDVAWILHATLCIVTQSQKPLENWSTLMETEVKKTWFFSTLTEEYMNYLQFCVGSPCLS